MAEAILAAYQATLSQQNETVTQLLAQAQRQQAQITEQTQQITQLLALVQLAPAQPSQSLRLPLPPSFDGSIKEAKHVKSWADKLRNFARFAYQTLTEPEQLQVAACFLHGSAYEWYQYETQHNGMFQDWDTFVSKLVEHYDNTPNAADDARQQLTKLIQGSRDLIWYCNRTTELNHKLPSRHEADRIQPFIAGLASSSIREQLSLQKPSTLSEAIAMAQKLNSSLPTQASSSRQRSSGPTPMEINSMRAKAPYYYKRPTSPASSTSSYRDRRPSSPHPRSSSSSYRPHRVSHNKERSEYRRDSRSSSSAEKAKYVTKSKTTCNICNEPGHYAKDCPNRSGSAPSSRHSSPGRSKN
jgi:Ty3 transposon capsid-like protein/Zinc knuckle